MNTQVLTTKLQGYRGDLILATSPTRGELHKTDYCDSECLAKYHRVLLIKMLVLQLLLLWNT